MYRYPSGQNYEVKPCVNVTGNSGDVIVGIHKLAELIHSQINQGKKIFIFDLYPGADKQSLVLLLKGIDSRLLLDTDSCKC